eukprot:scaffold580503_cov22-Prasinocladus_malaysianus.AAC.1
MSLPVLSLTCEGTLGGHGMQHAQTAHEPIIWVNAWTLCDLVADGHRRILSDCYASSGTVPIPPSNGG